MRILLTVIILLTWTDILGQSPIQKLPKPTQELIKDKRIDEKGFAFLEENFQKMNDREIIKTIDDCTENCVCSWTQQFNNGITYTYNGCSESGFNIVIIFQGQNSKEVSKLVDTLFHTESNVWNDKKTVYKPTSEAAGCYFEIRQEKKGVSLEYYCTC